MKFIQKVKNFLRYYNRYNTYYQIPKNSAAICFYILISLISVFTLVFQILTLSDNLLETLLLPQVINIFSENFSATLKEILPNFSLSGFSAIVFLNFFWGASKTINAFNRMADYIYYQVKNRSGWKNRISAFLMFLMLLLVILFELALLIFSNFLIRTYFQTYIFLIRLVQFVIEVLIIFTTLLILYMYAPPIKMSVKSAYKGAAFATLLIYLLLGLFVIAINLMNRFGIGYTIITIAAYILLVLYSVNYVIISGMILNYHGNIYNLKTSLFRKQ
jgi:membrane protein